MQSAQWELQISLIDQKLSSEWAYNFRQKNIIYTKDP